MPQCVVPKCETGSRKVKEQSSTFTFPKDPNLRKLWLDLIPRKNFVPNKHSRICSKHFEERFLVTSFGSYVSNEDLSKQEIPRLRAKLTPDAIPTIFGNQTIKLSKRKNPEIRRLEIKQRSLPSDLITDFTDLKANFKKNVDIHKYIPFVEEDRISFCLIETVPSPTIVKSIVIHSNLIAQISAKGRSWALFVKQWSLLNSILRVSDDLLKEKLETPADLVSKAVKMLQLCRDHKDFDKLESDVKIPLIFLHDQLSLVFSRKPTYTQEIILWSAMVHNADSSVYEVIRAIGALKIPGGTQITRYLKKWEQSPESCPLSVSLNGRVCPEVITIDEEEDENPTTSEE